MALTAEGRSLTEAHRLAQIDLAGETIRDVERAWKGLLDPRRIEATFPRYFETSLEVVDRDHFRSTALSSAYLEAFHEAEGVATTRLDVRQASELAREQALSSLFYTGPAVLRSSVAGGATIDAAEEKALASTLRSSMRLSLQGGRSTISGTVAANPSIPGVARVTDGSPCSFCAMLAGRGAVYKSDSFEDSNVRFDGAGVAKVHDGCGCQMEPVYRRRGYLPPGRGKEFSDMWREIPGDLSPADSRRAFRGLYETGKVPSKYLGA